MAAIFDLHRYDNGLSCNVVTIRIGAARQRLVISVAYRPPDCTVEDTKLLMNYLHKASSGADSFIVLGDFNFPNINWANPSYTVRDGLSDSFQAAMDEIGLFQLVNQPTRNNNILDLALVSCPVNISDCSVRAPIGNSDHSAVAITLNVDLLNAHYSNNAQIIRKFDCNRVDIGQAAKIIGNICWRSVFSECRHVDDYVSTFMAIVTDALSQSTPTHRVRLNKPRSLVPKDVRQLILKKRRQWKRLPDGGSRDAYKNTCKRLGAVIRKHSTEFEMRVFDDTNKASFYKHVNKSLGRPRLPFQLICDDGCVSSNHTDISNAFSLEFTKNFSTDSLCTYAQPSIEDATGPAFNVTYREVLEVLSSSPNSAAGPDDISGRILRQLSHVLCLPVFIIFQQSLH